MYLIKLKKHVRHLSKKTNAKIAEHVGTEKLQPLHMESIKELRKRNKEEARAQLKVPSSNLDRAISQANSTRGLSDVRPGPGPKPQAVDLKINLERVRKQYTSNKHQATSSQATSDKHQAPSNKRQA